MTEEVSSDDCASSFANFLLSAHSVLTGLSVNINEDGITGSVSASSSTDELDALRQLFAYLTSCRQPLQLSADLIAHLRHVIGSMSTRQQHHHRYGYRIQCLCAAILSTLAMPSSTMTRLTASPTWMSIGVLVSSLRWTDMNEEEEEPSDIISESDDISNIRVILLDWCSKVGSAPSTGIALRLQLAYITALGSLSLNASGLPFARLLMLWISNAGLMSKGGRPALEIDGSPARDVFTLLTEPKTATSEQRIFIQSFSVLRTWLRGGKDGKRSPAEVGVVKDVIFNQCRHILDQVALAQHNNSLFIDAAVIELVALADAVCCSDMTLVPMFFPLVKTVHTRVIRAHRRTVIPSVLDFLLAYSEVVVHDPEPALRDFLDNLPIRDVFAVHEALDFCRRQAHRLPARCFPAICRSLAWQPRTLLYPVIEILPFLVTTHTCLAVFHRVLDLPTITVALERELEGDDSVNLDTTYLLASEYDVDDACKNVEYSSGVDEDDNYAKDGHLHQLNFNHINRSLRATLAVESAVPILGVVISAAMSLHDERVLFGLTRALLRRFGMSPPLLQNAMATHLLSLFERQPRLIIRLRCDLINFISQHWSSEERMLRHVVWIIGEYASEDVDKRCTSDVIFQFHETLELLLYENGVKSHSARLLTVLITSLAKLASRCHDLAPRVLLCLAKIVKAGLVVERAHELIHVLRAPNIAAVALNSNGAVFKI